MGQFKKVFIIARFEEATTAFSRVPRNSYSVIFVLRILDYPSLF